MRFVLHVDALVAECLRIYRECEVVLKFHRVSTTVYQSLILKLTDSQRTGSEHLTLLSGMLYFSVVPTSTVLQLCLKT